MTLRRRGAPLVDDRTTALLFGRIDIEHATQSPLRGTATPYAVSHARPW